MALASSRRFGDRAAIAESDRRYSFADVADGMRNFGAVLVERGLRPTERVVLWAPNSARWIVTALGMLAAGGVLVPINTRLTSEEAATSFEKSGAGCSRIRRVPGRELPGPSAHDRPDLKSLPMRSSFPLHTGAARLGRPPSAGPSGPSRGAEVDRRIAGLEPMQ